MSSTASSSSSFGAYQALARVSRYDKTSAEHDYKRITCPESTVALLHHTFDEVVTIDCKEFAHLATSILQELFDGREAYLGQCELESSSVSPDKRAVLRIFYVECILETNRAGTHTFIAELFRRNAILQMDTSLQTAGLAAAIPHAGPSQICCHEQPAQSAC